MLIQSDAMYPMNWTADAIETWMRGIIQPEQLVGPHGEAFTFANRLAPPHIDAAAIDYSVANANGYANGGYYDYLINLTAEQGDYSTCNLVGDPVAYRRLTGVAYSSQVAVPRAIEGGPSGAADGVLLRSDTVVALFTPEQMRSGQGRLLVSGDMNIITRSANGNEPVLENGKPWVRYYADMLAGQSAQQACASNPAGGRVGAEDDTATVTPGSTFDLAANDLPLIQVPADQTDSLVWELIDPPPAPSEGGFSLSAQGQLEILAGTPPGSYALPYRVCRRLTDPQYSVYPTTICDTAVANLTVPAPPPTPPVPAPPPGAVTPVPTLERAALVLLGALVAGAAALRRRTGRG